jgi:hypothetical protein
VTASWRVAIFSFVRWIHTGVAKKRVIVDDSRFGVISFLFCLYIYIYSLFNDDIWRKMAERQWIINWKGCGRKRSCYTGTWLGIFRKKHEKPVRIVCVRNLPYASEALLFELVGMVRVSIVIAHWNVSEILDSTGYNFTWWGRCLRQMYSNIADVLCTTYVPYAECRFWGNWRRIFERHFNRVGSCNANTLNLYLGGDRFESRPGFHVFFVVFLGPFRHPPGWCLD